MFASGRAVLLIGLCGVSACASRTLSTMRRPEYRFAGKDVVLSSGLRVAFVEDRRQPSVMVTTVLDAGAARDPQGKEGLAELTANLWFRASCRPSLSVRECLEALGGIGDSAIDPDATTYTTIAARESLPLLLELEAKRLTSPLQGIDDRLLNVEREVAHNRLRQSGEMKVSRRLQDTLAQMLFPVGHAYHRPVAGTHSSIDAVTLADACTFAEAHYRPENTTIVVTGDFGDVSALLLAAFPPALLGSERSVGLSPAPRVSGPVAQPPPPGDRALRHLAGPVTRTTVHVAWSLPGAYRGKDWLPGVVASLLQASLVDDLASVRTNDHDRVGELHCWSRLGVESSQAGCSFPLVQGEDPEKLADRARRLVTRLWRVGDMQNRERVLGAITPQLATRALEHTASIRIGDWIAASLHYTGQTRPSVISIEQLEDFQEIQLREYANTYLRAERGVAVTVEPETIVSPSAPARVAGAVAVAIANPIGDYLAGRPDSLIADLAVVPELANARELMLANGLRVIFKPHGAAPLVKVALLRGGGGVSARSDGCPGRRPSRSPVSRPSPRHALRL